MSEWKIEIKSLAKDFCVPQVKVNQMLKAIENNYKQREMPSYYKGNRDEYLYDTAQRELMTLVYA